MLTLFTCPKPADEREMGRIQRAAAASWRTMVPEPRMLALDGGTLAEPGSDVPRVPRLFQIAERQADTEQLAYVNADIVLGQDFIEAVKRCERYKKFLMVGHRWNVDLESGESKGEGPKVEGWEGSGSESGRQPPSPRSSGAPWGSGGGRRGPAISNQCSGVSGQKPVDGSQKSEDRSQASSQSPNLPIPQSSFCSPVDTASLRARAVKGGDYAIDYFVFTKGLFGEIPPFLLGRFSWDNWLIWRAHQQGAMVIDASDVVAALHLNHDYSHTGVKTEDEARRTREAEYNRSLCGEFERSFSLKDCTHRLTAKGLVRSYCNYDSERCVEIATRRRGQDNRMGKGLMRAAYELAIRWQWAREGRIVPLLKFPAWLLRRR